MSPPRNRAPADAPPTDLTGHVVVVLDLLPHPDAGSLEEVSAQATLTALGAALEELGSPGNGRLVTGLGQDDLAAVERRSLRRRAARSLAQYWRIDVRHLRASPVEVARRLTDVPGVRDAYAERAVSAPTAPTAPGDLLPTASGRLRQRYLAPPPHGVNAAAAWAELGGRGEGVRLADVEAAWRRTHVELRHLPMRLVAGCDARGDAKALDHGTATLGVIGAADDGRGVTGLATRLETVFLASHVVPAGSTFVAEAITAATRHLRSGDVLLLEVQRGVAHPILPIEVGSAELVAIDTAVGAGITVVEAAGNGSLDLDERREMRPDPEIPDSGAVVVGAARSRVVDDRGHRRLAESNYGSRVDCHAWGENVATTDGSADDAYTAGYGGTSSASAIVAGVAAVVQGMARALHGGPLDPVTLRELLRDPGNTTPQVPAVTGLVNHIGGMPDLAKLATAVRALA